VSVGSCKKVLEEVYEALVEGGWLRIVVPDLELYAVQYLQGLGGGGNVMPYNASEIDGINTPAVPFNIVMRSHGHQFIYDFATMEAILKDIGYRNIIKCSYRVGNDERLLKDSKHRRVESLYVEAQKSPI